MPSNRRDRLASWMDSIAAAEPRIGRRRALRAGVEVLDCRAVLSSFYSYMDGPGTMLGTFGPFEDAMIDGGPGSEELLSGSGGFDNPFEGAYNYNGYDLSTLSGAFAVLSGQADKHPIQPAPASTWLGEFIDPSASGAGTGNVTSTLLGTGSFLAARSSSPTLSKLGSQGEVPDQDVSDLYGSLGLSDSTGTLKALEDAAVGATNYDRSWGIAGTGDFGGDAGLLWRDPLTGEDGIWSLENGAPTAVATLPSVPDSNWIPEGTARLTPGSDPDIVWRNYQTGQDTIWTMDGTDVSGTAPLPAVPGAAWTMVGSGKMTGDGDTDLIWRNYQTGQDLLWDMSGTTLKSSVALPSVADPAWKIVDVADMTGDGRPDIIWRGPGGADVVWQMNGTSLGSVVSLPTVADPNWEIAGAEDVNGDGQTDLIWQDVQDREQVIWQMNGTSLAKVDALPDAVQTFMQESGGLDATQVPVLAALSNTITDDIDQQYVPAASADYSGTHDGAAGDIVLRNYATGEDVIELMKGDVDEKVVNLPTVADKNFVIVGAGNIGGPGSGNIVWRDYATGQDMAWIMQGDQYVGTVALPTVADTNWVAASTYAEGPGTVDDIIWRDSATGQDLIWQMGQGGSTVLGTIALPAATDPSWTIAGAGFFQGDTPDGHGEGIIWRNSSTGQDLLWYSDSEDDWSNTTTVALPTIADPEWKIVGIADINPALPSDDFLADDILWYDSRLNINLAWLMGGSKVEADDVLDLSFIRTVA